MLKVYFTNNIIMVYPSYQMHLSRKHFTNHYSYQTCNKLKLFSPVVKWRLVPQIESIMNLH